MTYGHETDVAVVGGGPAGMAAAIQLKRSGVACLVFERGRLGGLLANANLVENYPGFPGGIRGMELARLMEEHLRAYEVEVIPSEVRGLRPDRDFISLATSDGGFHSRVVVAATGTRPQKPHDVVVRSDAIQRVFYEIVPILDTRDKEIVIVGSGDAAFDYALNLGRRNKVTILNRGEHTCCLDTLRKRAEALESITHLKNTTPAEVALSDQDRISVRCGSGGGDVELLADYVVFAIGREPEVGFLSGMPADEAERLRSGGSLHLAGDVARGDNRQTAIAVGDGVRTAMEIRAILKGRAT
jgi:thioredoxin reductase (NADPH)